MKKESGGDDGTRKGIVPRIRASQMGYQLAVIDDTAQFKSAKCPRRTGKTVMAGAYLITFCEENPGARCVFGTMTLKRARAIILNGKDGLRNWNKRYSLGLHFNEQDHVVTFPNGSKIFVMGFETAGDIDKVRGEPFDLIILDECKSFPPSIFQELIDEAIEPTLLDNAGSLLVMGTPGPILKGQFYEATSDTAADSIIRDEAGAYATARPFWQKDEPTWKTVDHQWSYHTWTLKDNTAHKVKRRDGTVTTLWEEALALKRRKRWPDNHPIWRREYLGHWVADDSVLVYRYNADRNGWTPPRTKDSPLGLPRGHDWRFGIGCDLGFDNAFALQVFAWCDDLITSAELKVCGVVLTAQEALDIDARGGLSCYFQVYEFSAPGLTIGPIVGAITIAREVVGHDFDFMVADRGGQGKTVLATIEEEYGLVFEPADKHEKTAHIELWNSDLLERRCLVIRGSRLAGEMEVLPWKLPRGVFDLQRDGAPLIRKYTDETFAQDNADAGLYCVTRAQHRFAKAVEKPIEEGSPEWKRQQAARAWSEVQEGVKEREIDAFGEREKYDGFGDTWH